MLLHDSHIFTSHASNHVLAIRLYVIVCSINKMPYMHDSHYLSTLTATQEVMNVLCCIAISYSYGQ